MTYRKEQHLSVSFIYIQNILYALWNEVIVEARTLSKKAHAYQSSQQYTDMRKLRSDMKQNAMNFEHFISFYLSK